MPRDTVKCGPLNKCTMMVGCILDWGLYWARRDKKALQYFLPAKCAWAHADGWLAGAHGAIMSDSYYMLLKIQLLLLKILGCILSRRVVRLHGAFMGLEG
jgi:hypothetical protein